MICYGLPAYISNWMTGSVLESSALMNPKQMTLTSSTWTMMPSTPSRCSQEPSCPDQLDVVADQVLQVPFHGHHLPAWQDLRFLQPALCEGLQGGAAHHYQDELQDCVVKPSRSPW